MPDAWVFGAILLSVFVAVALTDRRYHDGTERIDPAGCLELELAGHTYCLPNGSGPEPRVLTGARRYVEFCLLGPRPGVRATMADRANTCRQADREMYRATVYLSTFSTRQGEWNETIAERIRQFCPSVREEPGPHGLMLLVDCSPPPAGVSVPTYIADWEGQRFQIRCSLYDDLGLRGMCNLNLTINDAKARVWLPTAVLPDWRDLLDELVRFLSASRRSDMPGALNPTASP